MDSSLLANRAFAILSGPLYALAVGGATFFVVPGVCVAFERRTGMEVLILSMFAAGIALILGVICGVAAVATQPTAESLGAAIGRIWKGLLLVGLPVIVGLMLIWELGIDPVIC